MQLAISMHSDAVGWVAFGAKRGANSRYKREERAKMGQKRRKPMEGGVDRWEPLRCQLMTAIVRVSVEGDDSSKGGRFGSASQCMLRALPYAARAMLAAAMRP
jgi:hypothetical protein